MLARTKVKLAGVLTGVGDIHQNEATVEYIPSMPKKSDLEQEKKVKSFFCKYYEKHPLSNWEQLQAS